MTAQRRALLIHQGIFPSDRDIRIHRLLDWLMADGWQVHVATNHFSLAEDSQQSMRGVVTPVRAQGKQASGVFDLKFERAIRRVAVRFRPNVIVSFGLRTSRAALQAGRQAQCPVIVDLAEPYEFLWQVRKPRMPLALERLRGRLVGKFETMVARRVQGIMVVAPERRQELEAKAVGVPIAMVGNYPSCSPGAASRSLTEFSSSPVLNVCYVGIVTKGRGLEFVIEGLSRAPRRQQINFHIFGDGPDLERLIGLAQNLGVSDQIHFYGWTSPNDWRKMLESSMHLGIIPHRVNELTDRTIPNKLYDYMCAGIPVLATPMRPVSSLIRQRQAGWIVDDSAEGFAGFFESLPTRRDLYVTGRSGRAAVLKELNTDSSRAAALELIMNVVARTESS